MSERERWAARCQNSLPNHYFLSPFEEWSSSFARAAPSEFTSRYSLLRPQGHRCMANGNVAIPPLLFFPPLREERRNRTSKRSPNWVRFRKLLNAHPFPPSCRAGRKQEGLERPELWNPSRTPKQTCCEWRRARSLSKAWYWGNDISSRKDINQTRAFP